MIEGKDLDEWECVYVSRASRIPCLASYPTLDPSLILEREARHEWRGKSYTRGTLIPYLCESIGLEITSEWTVINIENV